MKFGPLWFMPGIRGIDSAALLLMVITNISMITLFMFIQPYLLTEILQIPQERQGTLTGNLASLQEIVLLLLMGFVGAMADKKGRRKLAAIGFAAIALGFFLYPLVSTELQLYLYRLIFGLGVAIVPVVTTASVVSYIQDVSRGKWSSVVSICNSVGIIFVAIVLSKMPLWLIDRGLDASLAGRYTYWTGAAICLLAVPLAYFRLRDSGARQPEFSETTLQRVLKGLRVARNNPRIPLAYTAGIIGRGDLVVISTFLSLWIVQAGESTGISTGQALARAGMVFAAIQTSALLWAPIIGIIVDRVHRVTGLAIAMGLAACGYLMMGQVADPYNNSIFIVAVVVGIGENSVLIAALALLGQEAPKRMHGTIVGMFLLMGSLGVIVASWVGGQLFDHWSKTGPFTLMGALNVLALIWAIVVRLRTPQAVFRDDLSDPSDL
jgi:MFS family permease